MRLRSALEADGLELKEVEFCESYFWTEWENEEDGTDEAGANEALQTGQVTYGTFHVWSHDAPDATEG